MPEKIYWFQTKSTGQNFEIYWSDLSDLSHVWGPGKQNSFCLRRMKAQIICCEMMERFIREITDQEVLPPSQIGYSERNEFAPSKGWKF